MNTRKSNSTLALAIQYFFVKINRIYHIALTMLLVGLFTAVNLYAQEDTGGISHTSSVEQFTNAVNMCPLALAFGYFSANYEHLFTPAHGLVVRLDYESVPGTFTDANIEASSYAVVLNYRWHVAKQLKSLYFGTYVRYREFNGTGQLEGTAFDFTMPEFTLGLNVGKRWVWNNGFNINFALGYGFYKQERNVDPSTPGISSAMDQFEKDYEFSGPFLGEFSIGYAF